MTKPTNLGIVNPNNTAARQTLFHMPAPVPYDYDYEAGEHRESTRYVVVSYSFIANETFAFPADKKGEILDFLELPGSRKGQHDPAKIAANVLECITSPEADQ